MKINLWLFLIFHSFLLGAINKESKIYVAGHTGLVGSALVKLLKQEGYSNIITSDSRTLDLRRQGDVEKFFEENVPDYVFLAAAKVGGVSANMNYPAEFMFDNLAIELNVIHAAYKYNVKKFLFLGSACVYPCFAAQPIKEEYLLTGLLDPTKEYYALAKIAGLKLCEAYNKQYPDKTKFITCLPCNLYGPNDNWNVNSCHVIPALIQKMYKAKKENSATVKLCGSGNARREFLHVDDMARACVFLMEYYESNEIINVGSGVDIAIKELANKIKEKIGFKGQIVFDAAFPDGMLQNLLDIHKIVNIGWKPIINLDDGLQEVIGTKYSIIFE